MLIVCVFGGDFTGVFRFLMAEIVEICGEIVDFFEIDSRESWFRTIKKGLVLLNQKQSLYFTYFDRVEQFP